MENLKSTFSFASTVAAALLIVHPAHAQDRPGIENSNYAGTNGISLNPSSMADSRLFLDFHVVGVNAQFNNNYVFAPESRIPDLFGGVDIETLGFNDNGAKKHGFVEATVQGPSAMMSLGRNGFGISTSVRSYTHISNIPDELADLMVNGYQPASYQGEQSLKNVSAKQLTWGEVGFSYARILKADRVHLWSGGITVKRLYGINSTNASLKSFSMTVNEDNTADLHQIDGELAYVTPAWTAGKGWGADLGFTYKRALNDANYQGYTPHQGNYRCEGMDYQYKIGFSILDIGAIKMKNEVVQRIYDRDFDAEDNTESIDLPDSEDPVEFAEAIFTEENATMLGNSFNANLPTAFSAQIDYNFGNNFYLNGTGIQRLDRKKLNGVQRANRLAITPRYETKHLEVSMPFTLLEYRHPMVGVMVRYRNVIVGTDNLSPWVLRNDLYRGDVYFHLKVPIVSRSGCKDRGSKQKARSNKPGRKYFKGKKGNCPAVVN